ncbi:MAG TPA: hypothetical protein VF702_00185 [Allosphingosinicella sp.]
MKYQLAFAVLAAAAAAAAIAAPRPVLIASAGSGNCVVTGEVVGLNGRRDNYLSVRAGPGVRERELDRLRSGALVIVCDETASGAWLGIVYNRTGNQDCFIGQTSSLRRPYRGPCRSGWVSSRYIDVNAG